jgi:Kef-type K+ transport system membrane component KefB
MNPVLTLGLVAAGGIAVTRLPRTTLRLPPPFALVRAAGTPLLLLGLLLGPGIGVVDAPTLRALAPLTALASGWIGAVLGARFEWRFVRRIPTAVWVLVLLQSVAVFGLVGTAAWLCARLLPALAAAWSPPLPAILALAAVAMVSGPGAVALAAASAGLRGGRMAHAVGLAALLDSAFGALGFALALAPQHPTRPVLGTVLAWGEWLFLAGGSAWLLGVFFRRLARFAPRGEVAIPLLGTLLLAAGVGYAAGLSPFLVCALAGAAIANISPNRHRVRRLLGNWEHTLYAILLIIAGALLRLPTIWIVAAVPVLAALRVAVKWAIGRYGRGPLRATALPPDVGFATVAQGGVALAFGIDFSMTHGVPAGDAVLTTIVLGMALAQVLAPPLMRRLLRTAPAARPTSPVRPQPLAGIA